MTKTAWRRCLHRLSHTIFGAAGPRPLRRTPSRRLVLEPLEDRLTPAFDLTVGAGATVGVSSSVALTTTTFTAINTGAFLNTADILNALNTGDVVVDSGSTGAENGDITISGGVTNPLASGHALTFQSGANAVVGDVTVNAAFAPQTAAGLFPLSFLARNNLILNAAVNAGGGTITLAATNGAVTETGGVVTAADLAFLSSGSAALGNVNSVGTLAGQIDGAFSFINGTNPLAVGVVGGLSGLASATDAVELTTGGTLTLNQSVKGVFIGLNAGGAVTQAGGAPLTATAGLVLQGAGPFTLTNANNSSPNIAAAVTGAVNYVNAGALQTATFNLAGFGDTVGVASAAGAVVLATVAGDLTVNTSSDLSAAGAAAVTAGGSESLLTVNGNIKGASAVLTADRMALEGGAVNVGAGTATLLSFSAGRPIDLGGSGDPAGVLQISNDEVSTITAAILRIGDGTAGDLSVTAPIQAANAATLSLATGGAILDANSAEPDVTVAHLALQAAAGISLDTQTSDLAFLNTSGAVSIRNTGALTVDGVDGVAASSNAGATSISTVGGLSFAVAVQSGGAFTAAATNSIGTTDGVITIGVGGSVQSTGGDVTFTAAAGLSILGPATAAGNVLMTGAGALHLSAPLTGKRATVEGGNGADIFTVDAGGSSTPLVLVGHGGGDAFNVTALKMTSVAVIGGGSGDVLNVEAGGDPLGVAMSSTVGNLPDFISYQGIPTIHLNDAAAVGAEPGPDTSDRAAAFVGLTSQERFVQALYLDDLGRAGTKAELDGWVAALGAPGGSASAVAAAVAHGTEGATHLVRSWYAAYLGRPAGGGEEQGWVNLLVSGQSEERVLSGILASPEFYARAQTLVGSGSADERFVLALYQLLIDRVGESAEVSNWVNATSQLGRAEVARRFLATPEFRTDEFEGNYNALLHRPSDQAGLQGWVNSGLDLETVRVLMGGGAEFVSNG